MFDLYSVLFRYVKLKFLKEKCFQTIVDNRKTGCVLSRCFLEVFFLFTEAIFQISDMCGLCTSRCIIIIAVCGQDKPIKKIT